jgi:WD40 repeat protein
MLSSPLSSPLSIFPLSIFPLSIASSANGTTFAIKASSTEIRVHRLGTGEKLSLSSFSMTTAFAIAISPDGEWVVTGHKDRLIRAWETGALRRSFAIEGHTGWIHCLAFSPDGSKIASGSGDCTIRLWDAATREVVFEPLQGHSDSVSSVSFSPDGKRLISGGSRGEVRLWDVVRGEGITMPFDGHRGDFVNCVIFSQDGSKIAACTDASILVWEAGTGVRFLNGRGTHSAAFSSDGTYLFSGHDDGSIRTWDLNFGRSYSDPVLMADKPGVPPNLTSEASQDIAALRGLYSSHLVPLDEADNNSIPSSIGSRYVPDQTDTRRQ